MKRHEKKVGILPQLILIVAMLLIPTAGFAEKGGSDTFPSILSDPPTSNTGNEAFLRSVNGIKIIIYFICHGRNMRGWYSTIRRTDTLRTIIQVLGGGRPQRIGVDIAASRLFEGANVGPAHPNFLDVRNAGDPNVNPLVGTEGVNTRVLTFTGSRTSMLVIDLVEDRSGPINIAQRGITAVGDIINEDNPTVIQQHPNLTVIETASNLYNYSAIPGVISGPLGQVAEFFVNVVGALGFCYSYRSPLMAFYDEQRPDFIGKSFYPVYGDGKEIWWVEPNAPGYFIAVDRDGDGKLTRQDELFGDARQRNGFKALAKFDTNKDSMIDAKDRDFKRLLLWNDKNGDGKSQKKELFTFADKKLKSISLKYKEDRRLDWGGRASLMQYAHFTFEDEKGKERKGEVIDVWFNQTGRVNPSLAQVDYADPNLVIKGPSIFDALRTPLAQSFTADTGPIFQK